MIAKKEILVSIIVPVYSVSKYLRRCLDSCVFQTLEEIEIIVVNDNSPDKEDAFIMEEYKKDYPERIRLVYHKENLGLGGARNSGIKLARGKYLTFIDSDDYVDVSLCKKCYESAKSQKSDIVLTYFYTCNINGTITFNKRLGDIKSKNSLNIYPAWAMLIKKDLITKSNIWFPEKLYHEDNAVTPLWQAIAGETSVVEEPLYYYIQGHPDAITSLKFELRIEAIFKSYDILLEHTEKFPQYFDLMSYYFFDYISNRLKEINSVTAFRLFTLCFCKIYHKYELDIGTVNMQKQQIFQLLLGTSADVDWDKIYSEYSNLIKKYYLSLCSKKELSEIFQNENMETVCVWGCGNYGTELLGKFGELGFECLVTDMNVNKIGKIMPNGSVVKPWNEIKDVVKTLIIGVSGKFEEISNLVDNGVKIFAVDG